MAAPLVVSFWMRAAVTFVDTVYASLLGDAAVAAIGLTIPFDFFMIAVWVGLSTGLTSALSRAMGAGEGRKIDQYVRACWKLVWIAAPMFTLLGAAIWLGGPHLGPSQGVDTNVRGNPVEPSSEGAAEVEAGQLRVGLQERCLGAVLGLVCITDHPDTEGIDRPLVAFDELAESVPIAAKDLADDLAIGKLAIHGSA